MKILITGCCVLTLGISLQSMAAEQVFESIDDKGNVTFSDSVPADAVVAEPITITPAPAPNADLEPSLSRDNAAARSAEDSRNQRQRAMEQQRAAAQKRVEAAEANLAEAKEFREGDRQGMAGGGSRIKPEYFQRVEAAEQELQEAKEAAKQVGR
ncbi:MAG: DUF4124 domain-containing protein [Sedimenticolaceae bacterium]